MAKSSRVKQQLEEKKRRLRSQIQAADKLLNQVPRPELLMVLEKVGIRASAVARGNLRFDLQGIRALTGDERRLFVAWLNLILDQAKDSCDLEETELLLHPRRGADKKAVDPRRQAAIHEWNRAKPPKPSFMQLAIKHSGLKDPKAQKTWAENLKKTVQRNHHVGT